MKRTCLALMALAGLTACNDMSLHSADEAGGDWDSGGWGAADQNDTGDNDWEPPEDESDFFSLAPAPTPTFVFIANPSRDTVTRVSVPQLEVITAQVGTQPDLVEVTPDYAYGVTFNTGSDDVSILESITLAETRVDVRENLDAMEMSTDGGWVVLYNSLAIDDDGNEGATSTKEVSFVEVATGEHQALAMGFQPRDVLFTDAGDKAVFLGDAWLGIVQLEGELHVELVQIADDLLDPPSSEECILSPAGDFAIIRQREASELVLVDLVSFEKTVVEVGESPTDLDVTPDGSEAIAVARGSNELWIYDFADPTSTPSVLALPEGETLGSVVFGPDGAPALLYSTVSGRSRYVSWDRDTDEFTVRPLPKPVAAVGMDPTGGTAMILHTDTDADDMDPSYEGRFGLSMVNLESFLANDYILPAEPSGFAHSDDGLNGFLILEGHKALQVLDYANLLVDEKDLRSEPVHVGTLPTTRWAYVNQEHELGRLSFYDIETDTLKTMTGFELNAGIEIEEE
jgi:DNA-binding beta-propeller fold protein YncE